MIVSAFVVLSEKIGGVYEVLISLVKACAGRTGHSPENGFKVEKRLLVSNGYIIVSR
jgi:hypothetical protein